MISPMVRSPALAIFSLLENVLFFFGIRSLLFDSRSFLFDFGWLLFPATVLTVLAVRLSLIP